MIYVRDPQVVELFGANGLTTKQQAKNDAQNITVGEARALANAMLNDFIANHLTQHMVPVVEHYMRQIPALVEAQLVAREQAGKQATVDRIMSALEEEAKQSATLGDPDE